MGISFGSINTGLPKDIVQQIIAAEKIPIKKMEARKSNFTAREKLVNDLAGLLEDLKNETINSRDENTFRELKVNTNDDVVGVAFDKTFTNPGNYQLEVVQLARKSSAMTSGFSSKDDAYIGVGFIEYTLPSGETKSIYVDSDNATLSGITKLINKDDGNGLHATVVNDGTGGDEPWRVIVSLADTGVQNLADFPYFYFVDGEQDLFLEFERPAQNAIIKVDGFEIQVPQNKVNDIIPGVTLDLKKAKPGEEFSINIQEDAEAMTGKIDVLINKINEVLKFIINQNKLDQNTDTQKTLGGDITIQTLESRLRSTIFKFIDTSEGPKRIGDLGVTFTRDGFLQVDTKQFEAQLSKNYKTVSETLVGRYSENKKIDGFIDNVYDLVSKSLRHPSGLLPSRKAGIKSRIDQIDRQISNRQRLITSKEKMLKDKFARLESVMSKLKSQGAGVAALAGSGGGGNVITQLG